MPFTVTKFANVKAQIEALLERAKVDGVLPACLQALKRIQDHLENRPTEWGDPDYNLIHVGATVFHGIEEPLVVRFAVYMNEKVVCVLDVKPLPTSPLAGT